MDSETDDSPDIDPIDLPERETFDPDEFDIITPAEKPYTVILFDPGSAFASGTALEATSHIIVHAETPEGAGIAAITAAQSAGRGTSWKYPEILFLTEGYHEDLGPGARRQVR